MSILSEMKRLRRLERMYRTASAVSNGYEAVTDVIDSVVEVKEALPESLSEIKAANNRDIFDELLDELERQGL